MWKYVSDRYCFEISFPDDWGKSSGLSRIPVFLSNTFMHANILDEFTNRRKEYLNIVMETMRPEPPPDITAMLFEMRALQANYTGVELGRINIGGRDHTWASYVMNGKGWLKKYMIVLNGLGYALTASCPIEQRNNEVEEGWDRIAASLKLTTPIDQDVLIFNGSYEATQMIESLRKELWLERERRRRDRGM